MKHIVRVYLPKTYLAVCTGMTSRNRNEKSITLLEKISVLVKMMSVGSRYCQISNLVM